MDGAKDRCIKPVDKGVRNTLLWIAGFISLMLGLLMAGYLMPRSLTVEQFRELGFYRFETPRVIGDFNLVDHTGSAVGLDDLKGRWSLLFFGFTFCPDICPTTLSVLNDVVGKLENPPQVVMVSVDPERDTPDKLADYVPAFNSTFRGFTGEFDEVVSLATQVNIAFGKVPGPELGTYLIGHTASIVVVNPAAGYEGFIKAPHNAQNIQRILNDLTPP